MNGVGLKISDEVIKYGLWKNGKKWCGLIVLKMQRNNLKTIKKNIWRLCLGIIKIC